MKKIHDFEEFLNLAGKDKILAIDSILMSDYAKKIWKNPRMLEWLKINIPEIFNLTLCMETPPHHKPETTYNHTIRVIYNSPKNIIIRRAALFHDVAKPLVRELKYDKKYKDYKATFYNHDKKGSEMASVIMRRIGYQEKDIKPVAKLIALHIAVKAYGQQQWKEKTVGKLIKKADGLHFYLLRLAVADKKGSSFDKVKEKNDLKRLKELKKIMKNIKY